MVVHLEEAYEMVLACLSLRDSFNDEVVDCYVLAGKDFLALEYPHCKSLLVFLARFELLKLFARDLSTLL